jgi:hypothetical protein
VPLIASYHNFQETPSAQDIVAKLVAMERAGADIAKVAVMPKSLRDVLTLLEATQDGMQAISCRSSACPWGVRFFESLVWVGFRFVGDLRGWRK